MIQHEGYMTRSLLQAQKWSCLWDQPFWVIVIDSTWKIVWEDHDRVASQCDPTAHAEINAIRWLCKQLQQTKLPWYIFYCSSEPCPTCLTACIKAKVRCIVYWAKTEKTASLPLSAEWLASFSKKHPIEIIWGILETEALEQREQL